MKSHTATTSIISGIDDIISGQGYDPSLLLAEHKLPQNSTSVIQHVNANRLIHFMQDLSDELEAPNLWQSIVDGQFPKTIGPVSQGALVSETVGDALAFMNLYCHRVVEKLEVTFKIKNRCVWIELKLHQVPNDCTIQTYLALSQLFMVVDSILPVSVKPVAVYIKEKFDRNAIQFYNSPIGFESKINALVYPKEILDFPLDSFDYNRLQNITDKLTNSGDTCFVNRVEEVIGNFLGNRPEDLSLEAVAKIFGVGPRMFQIRLSEANTTFQTLLTNNRELHAKRLLAGSDYSISQIGKSLGFSESSVFTRWFRHIEGESPTKWRNTNIVNFDI